ncbi:MAG: FecR domain-containing protein [Alistipes sp.]|nr:FecR domain-containing protein [Alistipes sp.]
MNSDYELNINLLILKYVNGSISEDEANLLAEWVKSSTQNARYFRSMCRSFENQLPATAEAEAFWARMKDAGRAVAQPVQVSGKRFNIRKMAAVVSSVLAVCVVAVIGLLHFNKPADVTMIAQQQGSTAEQELAESVADVAQAVHYTTSANELKHITLPDGSKVVLNGNSRLTQCEGFNDQERNVILCGEAYFDVAKSAKRFTVHTSDKSYIVHGTSFNIFDYGDNCCSIITLHTGKLEARVKENAYMLLPGEELRVDDENRSISKHTVDVENSIGWLNKQLKFSRLPLKFVANQLSHKYGVKINIHQSIENIVYTGQLNDEDITTALHLISITAPINIAITEFDGEYYISKRN